MDCQGKVFSREVTLRLRHTDSAGIIFHGRIFELTHDIYEDFLFTELGLEIDRIIQEKKYLMPIVHCEADFKKPIRAGDNLQAKLYISEIKSSSFTARFEFYDKDGVLSASAQTVHVMIDMATREKMELTGPLRSNLEKFLCLIPTDQK